MLRTSWDQSCFDTHRIHEQKHTKKCVADEISFKELSKTPLTLGFCHIFRRQRWLPSKACCSPPLSPQTWPSSENLCSAQMSPLNTNSDINTDRNTDRNTNTDTDQNTDQNTDTNTDM